MSPGQVAMDEFKVWDYAKTTFDPDPEPSDTVLLFGMRTDADYDIYAANVDPSNPDVRLIIGGPGDQAKPVGSPDGRYILYSSGKDLWVYDQSTEQSQMLIANARPEDWHPDQQRFFYTTVKFCDEGVYEAFFEETATGISVTDTRMIHYLSYLPSETPRYSPDGTQITFVHSTTSCGGGYVSGEIYTASLTGILPLQNSDLTRLTDNNEWDWSPRWTSDGQKIIWRGPNREILIRNADYSGETEILTTISGMNVYQPIATPPADYTGVYIAAIYDYSLDDIYLVYPNGDKDILDIGDNDNVDGIDWCPIYRNIVGCVEDDTGSLDIVGSTGQCGGSVKIPVRIQNAPNEGGSIGLEFKYDSAILTYKGFKKGPLVKNFGEPLGDFDVNLISDGLLRIGGYRSVSGIAPGSSGVLVYLKFDIADECDSSVLELGALTDDIGSWTASPGCFTLASEPECTGDVNIDGEITPADALCAFEKYMTICPTSCGIECDDLCGDVNGDGETTPADALCIFNKYLGKASCMD
jgi:Tol biopolymer transport system component